MKSIVELDVDCPQATLATLFTDPENSTKWMDDIERYEPLGGQFGMPGFRYRLVPKTGDMVFDATIIETDLPRLARLNLEASNVVVSITARFIAIDPQRTRLVSEEIFTFKGLFGRITGFLARGAIRKAHRNHMEAFKRFAERARPAR